MSTTPAYGARIERAPTEVVLEFTEQVSLIRGGVRLLNADGRELPTAEPRVSGRRLTLPLPPDLARGGYVVSWRVVSSDTHPVAGAFTFGIGAEPAGATAVDAGTRSVPRSVVVALAVYRWLGFVGTALLVGGGVFLLAIWPAGRGSRRARRLVLAGWAMVASATLLGLLIQGPHVDARPLRDAFDTELLREGVAGRFGAAHLARLALLAVVLTPLRRLLQADAAPGPRAYGALGLAAVVLAGTYAGAGHAASGSFSALAMVSDGTHLLVMSLWAGGLVLLGACALRPGSGPTIRSALSRFSTLALGSVALLAVTGTLQAWREVGSLAGFVDTSYGRLVLAKITIFGGLLLLGGLAWLAVRRGPDPATRLRRIVPFEVAGVAVVLAVTAVLVNTPPGATAQAVAPPVPVGPQHVVLKMPDGGTAEIHMLPGTVGPNDFHIVVHGAEGAVRAVPEAVLRASLDSRGLGPFDIPLASHGTGAFGGRVALPFAGDWRLEVTVRTTDIDAYVLSTTVRVGAPPLKNP